MPFPIPRPKNLNTKLKRMKRDFTQCYISPALNDFKKGFFEKWSFDEYSNILTPTVFFGMYGPDDAKFFMSHKGPKLMIFGGNDMHDPQYDPSNEMKSIFASMATPTKNFPEGSAASGSDESLTLNTLSSLLDKKLIPLHEYVSRLENKFENVENEIALLKAESQNAWKELREQMHIHEVNVENVHSRLEEHEKSDSRYQGVSSIR